MKKLTIALALVLCLVLCVFAFASCGKNNKKDTTADASTPASTAPTSTADVATTEEEPHVHVPGEFEILKEPTCRDEGEKVKYCETCGERLDDTIEAIPVNPDAHRVNNWVIVEPTLFEPVGSQVGDCSLCGQHFDEVLNWKLTPYSSVESTGKNIEGQEFAVYKTVADIRGDKSFAPTDEDLDGNDLWFEYSLLYNSTFYNHDYSGARSEIRLFAFRESTNRSMYRGFYYLYLRDNMDPFKTSTDCPFRGHVDYSTYDVDHPKNHEHECAYDLSELGNTLNGRLIGRYKAGWDPKRTESPYLWDSEWQTLNGWHRLGYRYHQNAEIKEGQVVYSGYTELYIDGVLCWKIDSNFKPGHKDSLVTKDLLLWTATIDENDPTKLNYTDHDTLMVEIRMDNFKQASKEVLLAIDDVRWTCGDGFAVPVKRVENPKPVETELKEGVNDVIAMYFAKPGCVHEAEDEWIEIKKPTLLEAGVKAKYCKNCGERMETEAAEYVPYIYNPADLDHYTYNNDKGMLLITKTLPDILNGDHFYPNEQNPEGKDLYFEMAILWNETMANYANDAFLFCLNYQGGNGNTFFYLNPKNDAPSAWCKFAGGFDYGCGKGDTPILLGPSGVQGGVKADYPNLGEYGWHKVGVRVHQEAALNGDNVVYSGVSSLYIDGELVWKVDLNMDKVQTNKNLLFTATNNDGILTYADNPNANKVRMQLRGENINNSSAPFYFIFDEVAWSVVDPDWTPAIEPVADPVAKVYKINDDLTVPASIYFQAKSE